MERWRGALGLLGDDASRFRWSYGAFELDPGVPPEGVDAQAYMAVRYDPVMVREMRARLAETARADGIALVDTSELKVRPSTFSAHRLLTAAREAGAEQQHALADALFRAYWARGEDIGDPIVLAAAAERAGMPADQTGEVLDGEAYAADVRAEERRAAAMGIHAVPTFVFAGQSAISGAQPAAVLAEAARRVLRGR